MGIGTTLGSFSILRNLLSSPALQATAWVDRYSTSTADAKEDRIETGHGFGQLAVDGEAIWVTNAASRSVARIDRGSGQTTNRAELGRAPATIAIGSDGAWIVCSNGWLWRFKASGEGEGAARLNDRARGLICDRASVWVLHANGALVGLDQATGELISESKIQRGGRQLLYDDGALLALSANGSRICRASPTDGAAEMEAKLPARGVRATLHDDTVWVACSRRLRPGWGALVPVNSMTMAVGTPVKLPGSPRAITAGSGHLWVACGHRGRKESKVFRITPATGEVTPWAETEWTIYDLEIADDRLLAATGVTLAGPGAGAAHAIVGGGGTPAHHGGHHGGGHGGGGH